MLGILVSDAPEDSAELEPIMAPAAGPAPGGSVPCIATRQAASPISLPAAVVRRFPQPGLNAEYCFGPPRPVASTEFPLVPNSSLLSLMTLPLFSYALVWILGKI